MDIKLSDIIWTIILFGLFTLVLNRLLIKPVLGFMDERKRRMDEAHTRAESRRAELSAARERALAEQEDRRREEAKESERRLAEASNEYSEELKRLSAELSEKEARSRAELPSLERSADEALDNAMDDLVDAFTEKLISSGAKQG